MNALVGVVFRRRKVSNLICLIWLLLPVELLRHIAPITQGVCHDYTAIPLTLTSEALPAESTLIIIFTGRFSGVAVITVCNAIMQ